MTDEKQVRAILILGKFRVTERTADTIKIFLGGSTTMTVDLRHGHMYDLREGDILTFYTECPLAKPQG